MSNSIQAAKADWLSKFNGAVLGVEVDLGSPLVRRVYHRTFDHVGRNAHFISVFGRVLLGEAMVREPEQKLKERIEENTKALDRKMEGARAILMDAGIKTYAHFNKPEPIKVSIISPIQKHYLNLLTKADELLVYLNTLWLHGEIDDTERSKREMEIKNFLRAVSSVSRKMRIYMQSKVNDQNEHERAKIATVLAEHGDIGAIKDDAGDQDDDDTVVSLVEDGGEEKAKKAAKKVAAKVEEKPADATAVEAPMQATA
jgi:hypothetical protein